MKIEEFGTWAVVIDKHGEFGDRIENSAHRSIYMADKIQADYVVNALNERETALKESLEVLNLVVDQKANPVTRAVQAAVALVNLGIKIAGW